MCMNTVAIKTAKRAIARRWDVDATYCQISTHHDAKQCCYVYTHLYVTLVTVIISARRLYRIMIE